MAASAAAAALDRFYAQFVPKGGLCFDIGAHVGNRSRSWSRLGATVVALEPQPDFARFLRWLFRSDANVKVREEAVAARAGILTLLLSARTPTVTTGSRGFIAAATRVPSFAWVRWDARVDVAATTLDAADRRATACPTSSRSTSRAWSTRCWLACRGPWQRCRSSSCRPHWRAPWPASTG